MSKHTKFFVLLVSLNIFAATSWSQAQVWPGDVNNNGEVNALDWVMVHNALGAFGPARPIAEQGAEWEEKTLDVLWGITFPGTTIDMAFADCNGDGVVNFEDIFAIDNNYLQEHGVISEDPISTGTAEVDPPLFFVESIFDPFPEGFVLYSDIYLGTEEIPVSEFNGITFDLVYNPEHVCCVDFIGPSGEFPDWGNFFLETFQAVAVEDNRIHVAISTFGPETIIDASGMIGSLFIVIEDDVLGMQIEEVETLVSIENVTLTGDNFGNPSPVVNDSLSITIVGNPLSNEEVLPAASIELFPNPISDWVRVESIINIEQVEIYNTLGQLVFNKEMNQPRLSTSLDLSHLDNGTYVMKVFSDNGFVTKKIIIQ